MGDQKYPRTFHLPWSPGATSDDRVLTTVEHFVGRQVVVTEKLDGECTTLYPGGHCHARSLDSKAHPSRERVRALAGQIGHEIPEGWRLNGENVYAQHSIAYTALPAYFLLFGIVDDTGLCLPWDEIEEYGAVLGLPTVPVLYQGLWDETAVKACFTGVSRCGGEQEGYVVRLAEAFPMADFASSVGKFVRENHVQTDEHWLRKPVIPNKLIGT